MMVTGCPVMIISSVIKIKHEKLQLNMNVIIQKSLAGVRRCGSGGVGGGEAAACKSVNANNTQKTLHHLGASPLNKNQIHHGEQ